MKEKTSGNLKPLCNQIAHSEDGNGYITSIELRVVLHDIPYRLNIATSKYVSGLREYNLQFPKDEQLEDRFYIVDRERLPSKDELCRTIAEIPFENLQPFLIELPEEL